MKQGPAHWKTTLARPASPATATMPVLSIVTNVLLSGEQKIALAQALTQGTSDAVKASPAICKGFGRGQTLIHKTSRNSERMCPCMALVFCLPVVGCRAGAEISPSWPRKP